MRLSPGLMLECLLGYFTSVQHSSSLVFSINKRNFVFFERVPLSWPEFGPGTFRTEGERLINYTIEEEMKENSKRQSIYAAIALRSPKGPRAFFEAVASHRGQINLKLLLENSRPTAYYFQGNN